LSFLPLFSTHSAAYAKIRTQNAYQHYPKKLTNGDPFRLYNYIVILFASQSIMLIISNIPCLTISCMPLIYSLKSLNYFRIGDDAYDVLYLGLRILRGIQPCCCTLSLSGLICSSSEECIYLVFHFHSPITFTSYSFAPLPIKFSIKYLLPWTKVELSVSDSNYNFSSHNLALQVRISIIFPVSLCLYCSVGLYGANFSSHTSKSACKSV